MKHEICIDIEISRRRILNYPFVFIFAFQYQKVHRSSDSIKPLLLNIRLTILELFDEYFQGKSRICHCLTKIIIISKKLSIDLF